jgi:cytochrome c oxidase assembly protein subunit 15
LYSEHLLDKGEAIVFNFAKAWTEYLNRLLGVILGFVAFATFLASFKFWNKDRAITYLSLLLVVLIGANGGLGKVVVDNYLKPAIVTAHMVLAIVAMLLLIYILFRANDLVRVANQTKDLSKIKVILGLAFLATFIQIVLGTQVREAIDEVILKIGNDRNHWIENLGIEFIIHRSFSWIVMALNLAFVYFVRKNSSDKNLIKYSNYLLGIIGIEFLTGIVMTYAGMPAFIQPIHLTLALLATAIQYYAWLLLQKQTYYSFN